MNITLLYTLTSNCAITLFSSATSIPWRSLKHLMAATAAGREVRAEAARVARARVSRLARPRPGLEEARTRARRPSMSLAGGWADTGSCCVSAGGCSPPPISLGTGTLQPAGHSGQGSYHHNHVKDNALLPFHSNRFDVFNVGSYEVMYKYNNND